MNEPTDEVAKLRRAFAAVPAVAPAPASCPAPDAIWKAVRGEQLPSAFREIVEHVASCPACAEDWRLALALEPAGAAAPAEAAAAETIPPRRRRRAVGWWASAAAAALALATFLAQPPVPVLRGERPPELLTVAEVLPRDACILRWRGPEGATYDLDIYTQVHMSILHVAALHGLSYQVPPAALAAIPQGDELAWQVTATLPDHRRLVSHARRFILH